MATEQLGVGPTADADLVRLVDMYPAFSSTFPIGTGAWTDYVPTLVQSGAVTKTVTYARYMQIGRMVVAQVLLAATGAGSAANEVRIGLPVAASSAATGYNVGTGYIFDASVGGAGVYKGEALLDNANYVTMMETSTGIGARLGTATAVFSAALASGDGIGIQVVYEAATGGNPTASPTAAWIDYTPTLTQGATVTKTVGSARYTQVGRTVTVEVDLTVTGSGTASNGITVGLPVAALSGGTMTGSVWIFDTSAGTPSYVGIGFLNTTTTFQSYLGGNSANAPVGVAGMTAALASGDIVRATLVYEAAAGGGIPPVSYAWTDYVPTWAQSATITKTITTARYTQVGRTVTVNVRMVATSAGVANNVISVSLPVAPSASNLGSMGSFFFEDFGTSFYSGSVLWSGSSVIFSNGGASASQMGLTGGGFTAAIASSDNLSFTVTYEAA